MKSHSRLGVWRDHDHNKANEFYPRHHVPCVSACGLQAFPLCRICLSELIAAALHHVCDSGDAPRSDSLEQLLKNMHRVHF